MLKYPTHYKVCRDCSPGCVKYADIEQARSRAREDSRRFDDTFRVFELSDGEQIEVDSFYNGVSNYF